MAIWGPLALGLGGSALDALFGGGDKFKMSPEQKRIYEMLMGEYGKGDFGYSAEEKAGMTEQLRQNLMDESQARTGSSLASLSRRGLLSPGQASGVTTGIQSAYGKAFGEGRRDIELASAAEGRRRKGELERALLGASRGQYVPGGDVSAGLGDVAGNWMFYELLKDQKKKPSWMDVLYG